MAYTTINKSTAHFNTKLYTGNAGTQSITGVGFQPDLTWIKVRNYDNPHNLIDSVRGATKALNSNDSTVEETRSSGLTAWTTDGFNIGNDAQINDTSSYNYVSWNWKAGTTGSGTSTGSGTGKAYSYSVNTTSGFSIVKYIGNGTAGHTIPHHLGIAPTYTIVKALGNTESWQVISSGLATDKFIQLDSNNAEISQGSYNMFNSTRPSSTVVTLGNQNHTNQDGTNYIMYNFCNVDGFSKSGSYNGNGNADGTFVYTGFKPAFVMVKKTDSTGYWVIQDNKRTSTSGTNPNDKWIYPNGNDAEYDASSYPIDLLSNGFKIRHTGNYQNTANVKYIYMAFGQSLVGSNNIPCTAR